MPKIASDYLIFRIIIDWKELFSKLAKFRISNVRDNKYGAFLTTFKNQSKLLKLIRSHLKNITIYLVSKYFLLTPLFTTKTILFIFIFAAKRHGERSSQQCFYGGTLFMLNML